MSGIREAVGRIYTLSFWALVSAQEITDKELQPIKKIRAASIAGHTQTGNTVNMSSFNKRKKH